MIREILGPEIEAKLFAECKGKCRNTGECTADCPEYPAEEVIKLMENRILLLQKENEQLVGCAIALNVMKNTEGGIQI